jgi:alkylation response protein AidB-like acyl-CoA dehydrogenase
MTQGVPLPVTATKYLSSDELDDILANVLRLAHEVLVPAEIVLDAVGDPRSIYQHELYRSSIARVVDAGWTRLSMPEQFGGVGIDRSISFLVARELSVGAPAFAGVLLLQDQLTSAVAESAASSPSKQAEVTLRSMMDSVGATLAWVLVPKPDNSPIALPSSGLHLTLSPSAGFAPGRQSRPTRGAVQLDRVQLPLVANGAFCSHLLLLVADANGVSAYLVDANNPAITREGVTSSGLRLEGFADFTIDGLELTRDQLLVDGLSGTKLLESLLARINTGVAFRAAGIASGAHAAAKEYCQLRVQGGTAIIRHQSIAETLWRAQSLIDALDQIGRQAAASISRGEDDLLLALRARTIAAEQVVLVVTDMLALLGAYGISQEYPLAKMYRDACAVSVSGGLASAEGVFTRVSLAP